MSAILAAAGAPVVGVSTARYLFHRHTPAEAAADLEAIIDHYSRVWGRHTVVLAGHSFGADILPEIVRNLRPETRARVRLVALLSPAARADFAFRGISWLDLNLPGALPLAPALAELNDVRTVCLYAQQDPRAACASFPPNVRPILLPGGHSYRGQEATATQIILAWSGLAPPDPAVFGPMTGPDRTGATTPDKNGVTSPGGAIEAR